VATDEARQRAVYAVETEGEVIYAEATGSGTPVVLCHGLGGNHAIWWRQIETFARHHRVITWDQRGFGNSTAATGDVSIDAAARDLLSILAELDLADACLIGQSMGAFTALRASLTDRTRIASLIISTSLVATPREYTEALSAAVGGRTGRDQHPVVSEEFGRFSPDLVVLYNLISSFGSKPASAAMLAHMARAEFTDDELRGLAVPAAFVAAELDEFCPPRVMAHAPFVKVEATRAYGAEVVLEGESLSEAEAKCWNEAVLELVAELRSSSPASWPLAGRRSR